MFVTVMSECGCEVFLFINTTAQMQICIKIGLGHYSQHQKKQKWVGTDECSLVVDSSVCLADPETIAMERNCCLLFSSRMYH